LHEDALERMQQRGAPAAMRLRRSTVEHPFGTLKYRIFGHPRFLLRGLGGAQTEISLGTMANNLKRMMKVLWACRLVQAIALA
jgi:transposase